MGNGPIEMMMLVQEASESTNVLEKMRIGGWREFSSSHSIIKFFKLKCKGQRKR
jgi:hypothetical protein